MSHSQAVGVFEVTKKIPQYLKLHVEDDTTNAHLSLDDVRSFDGLCEAFQQLTGWQLRRTSSVSSATKSRWSVKLDLPDEESGHLTMDPVASSDEAIPLDSAEPLATAIGELITELQRTRHVVWQREAELATGIPVAIRPDDHQFLANRLEAVLRGGAEAIGCQAAALYLLDDATSMLKLRSCWGLSKTRYLDPPRPLRGAVSDLEALVGHAVALEDTSLLPHWKVPEEYPAALCVPVANSSTPLGTLWFFANKTREFSESQTNIAEVIAGRLVAELEREVLIRAGIEGRTDDRTLTVVADRQNDHLPRVTPLVDGWQVAGRTVRGQLVGSDLFDWAVLPDGRLAIALGHAEGTGLNAALTATMLHTAIKSHAVHPHNPRQMLERLNETIWSSSRGDLFASLFYGVIDPESGILKYATAGTVGALLYGGRNPVLLGEPRTQLGCDPDAHFPLSSRKIKPGNNLVLFSRGVASLVGMEDDALPDPLVSFLQSAKQPTAEELVQLVLDQDTQPCCDDATVLVTRRLF
jgi:sigma-B regulation protein RsbU (phosphoserine phosphatase)